MIEYYTEALALNKQIHAETDATVVLYTRELGKISVKAKGLKKTLSKSGGHLEPLSFAKVRFIQGKNGQFQLVDAISYDKHLTLLAKADPEIMAKYLAVIAFIDEMTFELHPDDHLWEAVLKLFRSGAGQSDMVRYLLKVMGFDPDHAACSTCQNSAGLHFCKHGHYFICGACLPLKPIAAGSFGSLVEV